MLFEEQCFHPWVILTGFDYFCRIWIWGDSKKSSLWCFPWSAPHLLAQSSTNSSNMSVRRSPEASLVERAQRQRCLKGQKQAPCIPFLLPPMALNMLHPQRIIVFYQALPSPGPWSFRGRKAVLGLWEKEKCSYRARWGDVGGKSLVIFSVGSRSLTCGLQYLTAFLDPKNDPEGQGVELTNKTHAVLRTALSSRLARTC